MVLRINGKLIFLVCESSFSKRSLTHQRQTEVCRTTNQPRTGRARIGKLANLFGIVNYWQLALRHAKHQRDD